MLHAQWQQDPGQRRTVGADKAYDVREFVDLARELNTTPHVTQNVARRGGSAIDARTTRHEGYAMSQHARPRIELKHSRPAAPTKNANWRASTRSSSRSRCSPRSPGGCCCCAISPASSPPRRPPWRSRLGNCRCCARRRSARPCQPRPRSWTPCARSPASAGICGRTVHPAGSCSHAASRSSAPWKRAGPQRNGCGEQVINHEGSARLPVTHDPRDPSDPRPVESVSVAGPEPPMVR